MAPTKKRKKPAAKKSKKQKPAARKLKARAKPKVKAKAKPKPKKKKVVAAPRKKAKAKPASRKPIKRRDATGHLDPNYERELLRRSRENKEHDDDRAFLVGKRRTDPLAQELGREFVETVTSGEDEGIELRDAVVPEEIGGPFVRTTAGEELAEGVDDSNPEDSTREPFPRS